MSDAENPYTSPSEEASLGEQWIKEESPSLRQTGFGLKLVYYGIVIVLLSVIGMVAGIFVARGPGAPMIAIFGAATVGLIIGSLLMFVGPFFCLAVPAESKARGLIITSIVFQVANVSTATIQVLSQFLKPIAIPLVANSALNLAGTVGLVLFILFMKRLSIYIGRSDLAARAMRIIVGGCLLVVLSMAGVAAVIFGKIFVDPTVTGLLMLVLGICGLILFVMYANLINALGNALSGKK